MRVTSFLRGLREASGRGVAASFEQGLEKGRILELAAIEPPDNLARDLEIQRVEVADAVVARKLGVEANHVSDGRIERRDRLLGDRRRRRRARSHLRRDYKRSPAS